MTEQEVMNSLEFKLTTKILKNEFPFIKGMDLDGDPNTYKNSIYVRIHLDPIEMSEYYDIPLRKWSSVRKSGWNTTYLKIFVESEYQDVLQGVSDEIDDLLMQATKSGAVPQDMKLGKVLRVLDYVTA
jgi:hypothetical protein